MSKDFDSSIIRSGNEKIARLKKNLKEVKRRKDCIVLMSNDSGLDTTKVVYIDYVGDRWARGYSYVHLDDNTLQAVPETINYGDIFNHTGGLGLEIIFPDFIENKQIE